MNESPKTQTNRSNSRASTGPRTAAGRARAAQNARRHGLRVPVLSDPALSAEVEALAQEIAGRGANAESNELARRIAEAEIDLVRVRQSRFAFLSRITGEFGPGLPALDPTNAPLTTASSRTIRTSAPIPDDRSLAQSSQKGPHDVISNLFAILGQLATLDRYERRALSRRKFAIRAFNAARSQSAAVSANNKT